jgi:hypothetical protein
MDLLDEEDIQRFPELIQAKKTDAGRALLEVVERNHSKHDREMKRAPQINDLDFTKDFRYRLGFVEALYYVSQIPEEALQASLELEKQRKGG